MYKRTIAFLFNRCVMKTDTCHRMESNIEIDGNTKKAWPLLKEMRIKYLEEQRERNEKDEIDKENRKKCQQTLNVVEIYNRSRKFSICFTCALINNMRVLPNFIAWK